MSYLLDTCVISEVLRPKPAAKVVQWLGQIPDDSIYLSVITIGELNKGILKLANAQKARRLQTWLDTAVRTRFERKIMPIDEAVALEWGRICAAAEKKGRPRPILGALIAATAIVHNLTLVTRNTNDFIFTRADIFNPWEL